MRIDGSWELANAALGLLFIGPDSSRKLGSAPLTLTGRARRSLHRNAETFMKINDLATVPALHTVLPSHSAFHSFPFRILSVLLLSRISSSLRSTLINDSEQTLSDNVGCQTFLGATLGEIRLKNCFSLMINLCNEMLHVRSYLLIRSKGYFLSLSSANWNSQFMRNQEPASTFRTKLIKVISISHKIAKILKTVLD